MVERVAAVVYRISSGKRYFTKRAAYRSEALSRLFVKHEREGIEAYPDGSPSADVYTEAQMEYFRKVATRYYRRFKNL